MHEEHRTLSHHNYVTCLVGKKKADVFSSHTSSTATSPPVVVCDPKRFFVAVVPSPLFFFFVHCMQSYFFQMSEATIRHRQATFQRYIDILLSLRPIPSEVGARRVSRTLIIFSYLFIFFARSIFTIRPFLFCAVSLSPPPLFF
jgi:hypothetical protein